MAKIEVEERVADALRAQARARDLPLEIFLERISEIATPIAMTPEVSPEEQDRLIVDASGESPALNATFSRSDIYSDHD